MQVMQVLNLHHGTTLSVSNTHFHSPVPQTTTTTTTTTTILESNQSIFILRRHQWGGGWNR